MMTAVAAIDADMRRMAVMREAVEQRGSHFWVAKDAGPFTEGEICCDDDRRAFVETADQVERAWPPDCANGR